ncbi:hypothetical protein NQ315_013741 [Exocentrus adspersus]|uniref:Uncharacterized protein n=1 Tax=Exocentrus adspersus TaxID=1586481 RepID=A0AAV8W4K1_9CUCU|nr:hypothetical protein NQ315_013741 [Exocentrus adspersus]
MDYRKSTKQRFLCAPLLARSEDPPMRYARFLAKQLQPYIGQSETYIKDSAHFIEKIKNLGVAPNNILVSFNAVSLFTMVPVNETMNYLKDSFLEDLVKLFQHCLTTTYFKWKRDFYEQIDGVAMENPLKGIEKELKQLEEAFVANGYSSQEIKRAIRPNRHRGGDSHEKNAEQSGFACLPYIHKGSLCWTGMAVVSDAGCASRTLLDLDNILRVDGF